MTAHATDIAVSTRVRAAAVRAIAEFGRPLTVHEIDRWILDHQPDITTEMATKCHDYLRIILSLAPATMLAKYRCLAPAPGADQRAGYFGLPSIAYDRAVWLPSIAKHGPSVSNANRTRPRSNRTPPNAFDPLPNRVLSTSQSVSRAALVDAWNSLTSRVHPSDEFWVELRTAMNQVQAELERGVSPERITKNLLEAHVRLNAPWIREHVVMILMREITRQPTEALFQPAFDALFV
jgi:hypothetical protein